VTVNTRQLLCIVFAGIMSAATPVGSPAPTFTKNVAPILQANCQSCHRPGEAAPFSLLTYEQTRPWAKAIKATVLTRKMPPWFADPHYGKFLNDRSLPQSEIDTIASWVDAGAPKGDPKDMPPAREFTDGLATMPPRFG
jgi:mono/diheme cytochrome c family protein